MGYNQTNILVLDPNSIAITMNSTEVQNPWPKLDEQAKIKEPCPYLQNCAHNSTYPIQGLILRGGEPQDIPLT